MPNEELIKIYDVNRDKQHKPSWTTRAWGLAQAIGGAAQAVGGVAWTVTPPIGVKAGFGGGALFVDGSDNFVTGSKQLWYGTPQRTLKYQALEPLVGSDAAFSVDVGASLCSGLGMLRGMQKYNVFFDSTQEIKINLTSSSSFSNILSKSDWPVATLMSGWTGIAKISAHNQLSKNNDAKNTQNNSDNVAAFPINTMLTQVKAAIGDKAPELSADISKVLQEPSPSTQLEMAKELSNKWGFSFDGNSSQTSTIIDSLFNRYAGNENTLATELNAALQSKNPSQNEDIRFLVNTVKDAKALLEKQKEKNTREERLQTFQASLQISSFLMSLGSKTNTPALVQSGAVLKLGLTTINSASEIVGKDLLPQSLSKVSKALGPICAVASCFVEVLSAFGVFGPSAEEQMMKQLQVISKQIHDMHRDMNDNFAEVYKCFSQVFLHFQQVNRYLNYLQHQNTVILSQLGNIETRLCDQSQRNELRKLLDKLQYVERSIKAGDMSFFEHLKAQKYLHSLLNGLDIAQTAYVNGATYFSPATDGLITTITPALTLRALQGATSEIRMGAIAASINQSLKDQGQDLQVPTSIINLPVWERTVMALEAFVPNASQYHDITPKVLTDAFNDSQKNLQPTIEFINLTRNPVVLKAVFKRYVNAITAIANAQSTILLKYSKSIKVSNITKPIVQLVAEQDNIPADTNAVWDPKNGNLAENAKWYKECPNSAIDIQKTFSSQVYSSPEWSNILKMCVLLEKWGVAKFDKRFAVYQLTDRFSNTTFAIDIGIHIKKGEQSQLFSVVHAGYISSTFGTVPQDWSVAYCPQAPDNNENPKVIEFKKGTPEYRAPYQIGNIIQLVPRDQIIAIKYGSDQWPTAVGYDKRALLLKQPFFNFTRGNALEIKGETKSALEKSYQAHRATIANIMLDLNNPAAQSLLPLFDELDAAREVLLHMLKIADVGLSTQETNCIFNSNQIKNNLCSIVNGSTDIRHLVTEQFDIQAVNNLEYHLVTTAQVKGFATEPKALTACKNGLYTLQNLTRLLQKRAPSAHEQKISTLERKLTTLTEQLARLNVDQQSAEQHQANSNSILFTATQERQISQDVRKLIGKTKLLLHRNSGDDAVEAAGLLEQANGILENSPKSDEFNLLRQNIETLLVKLYGCDNKSKNISVLE